MPQTDIEITEIEEFEPSRVDGVKSAANGFTILMLKSVDDAVAEAEVTLADVMDELDKAEANNDSKCDTCKGSGKRGNAKCKKCLGSGLMPKVGMSEKELLEAAKEAGVAPSGVKPPVAEKCPTCEGGGTLNNAPCPDCEGSGKDDTAPSADALHRVNADTGKITVGAGGRETIDKSVDLYDNDDTDLEKAKLKTKARDALPDSDFALPGTREYPIQDESHGRAALSMLHNASPADQKKIKAAVHRRYPDIGDDDAQKADGSMFTGPNPQLAAMATQVGGDDSSDSDSDSGDAPGSPAWEGVDADTATAAALALMSAGELIRTFAQREAIEVAAGEGNDIFDTFAAEEALCQVTHALGIMAAMAFHEGLEAAKSLPDDETVEKAGKRLSTRSVGALAAARDHLNELLGQDDPAKTKKSDDDGGKSASDKFIASANKALLAKEIDNMTAEELIKLLDERDAQKAAELEEAEKAREPVQDVDNTDSIAGGKAENSKSKSRKKKVADTDDALEDEAEQGDHDSANNAPMGATKAELELTPEEIEADEVAEKARKEFKAAKKAKKQATENAAIAKALEESKTQAEEAVKALEERLAKANQERDERLATVEKTVAPSTIVRSRPQEAIEKSAERDALELEVNKYDRMAKQSSDLEYRRECNDRAKALRVRIAALSS